MRRMDAKTLLLIAMLLVPATAAASSASTTGNDGLRASAAVDFRIDVPRVMRMRLVGHPDTVEVTRDDIQRGSVTIDGAALDILVNDRSGYLIRADVSGGTFTAVRIEAPASTCGGSAGGCVMRMRSMVGARAPAPMRVVYELRLDPAAAPGRYRWPVALSLESP